MDTETLLHLKDDFLLWSGGFAPESVNQIDIYVNCAMPRDLDDDEVRSALLQWLQETMSNRSI